VVVHAGKGHGEFMIIDPSSFKSTYISINRDDIERIKSDFLLMGAEVPVVVARVINRTLSAINTEAAVQVRRQYNLTTTRVKKNFKIRKATQASQSGGWSSIGRPVGLRQFGALARVKGYSVKVMVDGPRTLIPGTFIRIPASARVQMTGEQMYWRAKQGDVIVGRYPINRLDGPRIEDALSKEEAQKALHDKADTTIQSRLEAEANYILSKAK